MDDVPSTFEHFREHHLDSGNVFCDENPFLRHHKSMSRVDIVDRHHHAGQSGTVCGNRLDAATAHSHEIFTAPFFAGIVCHVATHFASERSRDVQVESNTGRMPAWHAIVQTERLEERSARLL